MNTLQRILGDKLNKFLIGAMIAIIAVAFGALFVSTAGARTQYDNGGTGTSKTPVFNEFYDVPNGIGDEADFVRIKPQSGGVGDYVDVINDACEAGSAFTVRTYVHNGADPSYNDDEAIARNVTADLKARSFNEVRDQFVFESTIAATNAASISDSAQLNCGQDVIMNLIPKSVVIYSEATGDNSLPDSVINGGPFNIGSREVGSGDVYACWEEIIIIEYEVEVKEKPANLHPAVCDLLEVIALGSKTVRVNDVEFTANDATINNISIDYGDGNSVTVSADKRELPIEHVYDEAGEYTIVATINTTFEGQAQAVTSDRCKDTVKIDTKKTPVYQCDRLKVARVNRNTFTFTVEATAENGATIKDYRYNFGDNTNELLTDKRVVEHTYINDGTYNASVTVRFNVNGEVKTASSENCKATITVSSGHIIPVTGAGSIAGVFAAVTAAGAAGHNLIARRRK